MHSWKYKKLKDEQRKARRKTRKYSLNLRPIEKKDTLKEIENKRFFEKMRKIIWRSIFRSRV